ncbi:MAG: nucleotidyltransferase family protein [Acidobacteriia bacterium]|nr:nucleotidyltransferase family protein [Terriglobia bacterium]
MAPTADLASSAIPPREDEFDLLCALAGANLSSEQIDCIAHWNRATLDWGELLRLAEHHGVLPLAARNLIKHALGLPSEVEHSLRSAYDVNLRRSLWFSAELARIMQHFERAQVRVVPYKGPVLAQSTYGDPGLRSFSDLDFLISSADFERAKRVLAEIGYHASAELPPAIERLWLRTGYECSFDGAAGKNLVELQWALLPHFYAVDLRTGDLLGRASRTVAGGCEMPCLSPEDSLLALSLHAAKHLWTRLIWLSDIAETLRVETIDYSLVFSRARALGVARILGVSFWLVKNVLRAELPKSAEEMIAADSLVPVLGAEIAERLARGAGYDFESTDYFRLILKLRERRGDRWRYLWRLVWTPGAGDVAAVRLPEALFPLYRIVRIGRLLGKLVSR